MLARSIAISFAFCSFLLCARCKLPSSPVTRSGELAYGYPRQKRLEEGVVLRKGLLHLAVVRDVDEDREGVLRDRRVVLDEEL